MRWCFSVRAPKFLEVTERENRREENSREEHRREEKRRKAKREEKRRDEELAYLYLSARLGGTASVGAGYRASKQFKPQGF